MGAPLTVNIHHVLASLLKRRLVLITGKGGVGKTVVSAHLALYAASLGRKVCLVSSSAEDQIAPLFGCTAVSHQLMKVRPNIYAINLDPKLNFRDFVVMHLGFAKVFEQIFSKALVQNFIRMIPGIAEITLLGRLFYHCELDTENGFDLVIFDGFASGHFISLLKTPRAILNAGFVGPVIKETRRVLDYLLDREKTTTAVVAAPDSLILSETVELLESLTDPKSCGVSVHSVFINRMYPQFQAIYGNSSSASGGFEKTREYLHQRSKICHDHVAAFRANCKSPVVLLREQFWLQEPLDENSPNALFELDKLSEKGEKS